VQFERFSCDAYHTTADKPASSSLGALLAPSGAFDLILIRLTPARLIDDVRSALLTSLTEPRGVRSTSWEGRMADLEVTNWFGDLVSEPCCGPITDRNREGFCRPRNPVGLPGLDGGA
jgi:hypothetical protein